MSEFSIFRRFNDIDAATEMKEAFQANGLKCKLIYDFLSTDITLPSKPTLAKEFQLMILSTDFETANKILEEKADEVLNCVNSDHYLFDFNNAELIEVLQKPDEWTPLDYKLARKILKDRGKDVDENVLQKLKHNRIEDLSKPDKSQLPWIIVGYFFSILGGLIGLFIGWYLWTLKKTLPSGEKVFIYSDSDRTHGLFIFIIGLIFCSIGFILAFLNRLNL